MFIRLSEIIACPRKPNPKNYFGEQVSESSFWMSHCSTVERTGSCSNAGRVSEMGTVNKQTVHFPLTSPYLRTTPVAIITVHNKNGYSRRLIMHYRSTQVARLIQHMAHDHNAYGLIPSQGTFVSWHNPLYTRFMSFSTIYQTKTNCQINNNNLTYISLNENVIFFVDCN